VNDSRGGANATAKRKPGSKHHSVRLWPTPSASLGTHGGLVTPEKAREGGTLIEAVSARMNWPTPGARLGDPKRGTPSPEQAAKRYEEGRRNLDDAVALWPTPSARDWKSGSSNQHEKNSRPLNEVVYQATPGPLNPTWVEWLMGFPSGWTDLGASETPSSPESPSTSDDESSS
jgi:hypothetical protein